MDQNQKQIHESVEATHLSDLMDDLVSDEAIEQLLSDKSQGEAWYRYQAVSAVLKDEHSAYSDYSFTESISAKIANEPAHTFSDQDLETDNATEAESNVIPLNAWHHWKRFTGGMAVAASVAFAMVFSVQFTDAPVEQNEFQPTGFVVEDDQTTDMPASYEFTPADTAEQKKLEEIQRYLDRARHQSFGVNEQLVSSDIYSKSFVVELKEKKKEDEDEKKPESDEKE